jgi:hypothetical protein
MSKSYPYYLKWLCILLVVKFFVMSVIVIAGVIGLGPDEAQYWTWSQALDLGYYSKPPGIAWQIWLGTEAFGNNEFGVRFIAMIFSFLQALGVFLIAVNAGLKPRTAFWCGVMMALSPIGILGSLMAITDGGMLLFWTFASVVMVSALRQAKAPNSLVIGGCILCGALFKWPVYLFWIFYCICWRRYFSEQKLSHILAGIAISLVGLLPSVWWNAMHDWATFRHVTSTIQGGQGQAGSNFLSFIGSQAALVSPILFLILILSFVVMIRQWKTLSPAIFYCGLVSFSCLTLGATLSLFQKIQGNWVIYAYPTAFVVIGWKINEWGKRLNWVMVGIALSVCLTGAFIFIPFSYRINPFKHNQGWRELNQALVKMGYDPKHEFLVSDKYQTASLLSFYSPEQKRAHFLNLDGKRNNQFTYWPGLESEEKGSSGYFVWIENTPYLERDLDTKKEYYEEELKKYFHQVEFVAFDPLLKRDGRVTKGALFFRCTDCYHIPQTTALW